MGPGGKSRRDWVGRIRWWIFKVKKRDGSFKRGKGEKERKGKKGEDEKRNEKK